MKTHSHAKKGDTTYDDDILSVVSSGSRIERDGYGIVLHVACKHGHTEAVSFGKRFPSDAIRRMLSNKGWRFRGNKATCPAHADCKVKGEDVTQMSEAMKAAHETKVVPIASPNAKQAKRDALRWLDESFDTVAGRYKEGMSDQKIADETGLSVKAVADLRAEFGYDLKTDPEVVAMLEAVAALRADIEAWKSEVAEVSVVLLGRMGALEQRLARYEAKS